MKAIAYLVLCLFLFSCGHNNGIQSWPQFRGSNGSGIADVSSRPPILFDSKNLLWKVELLKGTSSPVIFGGKLFITCFNENEKELQTLCFDRKKGKVLWSTLLKPDTLEKSHQISCPAQSCTATDGERVIAFFGSCGLFCYDMEGEIIWTYRMPSNRSRYGSATSPIIAEDKIILLQDYRPPRYLIALNKYTGAVEWKTSLNNPSISAIGCQSSPCFNNNMIFIHRIGEVSCYSVSDGSQIWNYKILTEGVSSPILAQDMIVFACWYNFSEEDQRVKFPEFNELINNFDENKNGTISYSEIPDTMAYGIRPESSISDGTKSYVRSAFTTLDKNKDKEISNTEWKETIEMVEREYYKPSGLIALNSKNNGELTDSNVLWRITESISEVPTPIFYNDLIYMIKDGGILTCVNSVSGEVLYKTRIGNPGSYIASPIIANGFLYLFGYNGKMKIIKTGDMFEVIGEYDFKDNIAATPAIIGNTIYLRTSKELLAYSTN